MLAHDVAGDGDPVVLLHSSVCDRHQWDAQWPALTDRYRAVRCDLPGSGDSPLAGAEVHPAEAVRALLDELDLGTVTLVGSSFGGRIALEFASTWPERVGRLVLICAGAGLPPGPELERFDEAETDLLEAGDVAGAVELNVRTWLGPDADDAAHAYVRAAQRRMFDTWLAADPEPATGHHEIRLDAVTMPTVVVSGAHDLSDFRYAATHLATVLPDVQHVELPWAGHLPNLERPAEFTDLLLSYLRA